jgi:hypothetical protein
MSSWQITIATLIAIGALLTPLVKSRKLRRSVQWSIIFLVALGGVVQIVIGRRQSIEENKQRRIQNEIAESINELRKNSNEEKAAKESAVRRDDQARKRLQALIDKGVGLRNDCQGSNPSEAEEKWRVEVKQYLSQFDPDDEEEFLHSSTLVPGQPCFSRMNGYVFVLERIRDQIPID